MEVKEVSQISIQRTVLKEQRLLAMLPFIVSPFRSCQVWRCHYLGWLVERGTYSYSRSSVECRGSCAFCLRLAMARRPHPAGRVCHTAQTCLVGQSVISRAGFSSFPDLEFMRGRGFHGPFPISSH